MSNFFVAISILLLAGVLPAAAQRTPAVPPAPNCNVTLKGNGKWVGDPIIHPSGSGSCTQTYKCTGDPSPKPNEACKFTVQHTPNFMRTGQCNDRNSCTKCGDPPTGRDKEKCEWLLKKN
jgi:hypothetical protein